MFQRRGQFHSLAQQQVDLVGRHVHVVHLVEGHLARRGADQRDRIARHQDVGVGRLAATVEHDVVHPVAEDQQRALGRQHVDRHPRLAGDVVPPDAARVDHHLRAVFGRLARLAVEHLDARDAVLFAQKVEHLVVGQHLGAVRLGIDDVGGRQPERIDRAVGNAHRADHRRIGRRFEPQRLLRIDHVGADPRRAARLDELGLEFQPVFGQAQEQTVGLLDAMAGDPAQDHVLLDALLGRLAVRHGIACAAVQQTVITARRTRGDVAAFEQQRTDTAQGAVAGHTRTRSAAADNNHIELLCHRIFSFSIIFRIQRNA